jgi:hypothetical protein
MITVRTRPLASEGRCLCAMRALHLPPREAKVWKQLRAVLSARFGVQVGKPPDRAHL